MATQLINIITTKEIKLTIITIIKDNRATMVTNNLNSTHIHNRFISDKHITLKHNTIINLNIISNSSNKCMSNNHTTKINITHFKTEGKMVNKDD